MKTSPAKIRIEAILARFELKVTTMRRHILDVFLKSREALSQADLIEYLEKKEGIAPDRISIYRNLTEMKRKGLIHEVDRNKYVACTHDCSEHPHILLFCTKCSRHQEIQDHNEVHVMMKALGKFDFFSSRSPLAMKGICEQCA